MSEPDNPDETRLAPKGRSNVASNPSSGSTGADGSDVPERLGRFEIRRLLGEGAFGRVYLAYDPELQREVAIKVPHRAGLTREFRDRFLLEARAIAKIHHANVCPVHEVGTAGEVPYMVMHYVVGTTLAAVLKRLRAPMPSRDAVLIARKLALGISAAHACGVIHRDLKPANVLYDKANREVLITDFGLARVASASTSGATISRSAHGTPFYMPPEQWGSTAFGPVTVLADVYSLGIILYELLAGAPPFTGDQYELMTRHCSETPIPPSMMRAGIDERLDAICLKALEKKPADRYPSAKALADALAEFLRGGSRGGEVDALPLAEEDGTETAPERRPAAGSRARVHNDSTLKAGAKSDTAVDTGGRAKPRPRTPDRDPVPAPTEPKSGGRRRRYIALIALVGVLAVTAGALVLSRPGKEGTQSVARNEPPAERQDAPAGDPVPAGNAPVKQPESQPEKKKEAEPQPVTKKEPPATKKDEPPVTKKEEVLRKRAKMKVTLPQEDAELSIEGKVTKPSGLTREFETPELEVGRAYEYEFSVMWQPNNYTKLTRTKKVEFKGGDDVTVDLTKADPKNPDKAVIRWVPTPDDIVEEMLKLGKVGKDDIVYEPGTGDGRMLIAAVKKGAKKAVGIEIDPKKAEEAKGNVKKVGLEKEITIIEGDALQDRDYSEATVILLYMGNEFNSLLRPLLEKQLKPGTRIVSHRFVMGDWAPDKSIKVTGPDGDEYTLHLWTVRPK